MYNVLRFFHFCQNIEIIIFLEILNIVNKFWKDSIFKAEIFANLSLKYNLRNFRCRNTNYKPNAIHRQ